LEIREEPLGSGIYSLGSFLFRSFDGQYSQLAKPGWIAFSVGCKLEKLLGDDGLIGLCLKSRRQGRPRVIEHLPQHANGVRMVGSRI
jgi:hypothetical protein